MLCVCVCACVCVWSGGKACNAQPDTFILSQHVCVCARVSLRVAPPRYSREELISTLISKGGSPYHKLLLLLLLLLLFSVTRADTGMMSSSDNIVI